MRSAPIGEAVRAEDKRRRGVGLECFARNAQLLGGIFKFDDASASKAIAMRELRLGQPAALVKELAGTADADDAGSVLRTMSAALGSQVRTSIGRVLLPLFAQHSSFGFNRDGIPGGSGYHRYDTFMGSTKWRREGTRPWDGTPLRALNLSHLGEIYGSFLLCVEAEDDETAASISMFEFFSTPEHDGWQRPACCAPCPASGLACMGPPSVFTARLDKSASTCVYVYTARNVLPRAFSTPCLRRQGWPCTLFKVGEQEIPFDEEPLQDLSYCHA